MTAPANNRGWLWYFLIVFGLAVAALAALVAFNLRQQLKPEDFAAARQLWEKQRPADYDLVYIKRINDDARGNRYAVEVRSGAVVSARENGRELDARERQYHSMDRLLDDIERFLELGKDPKTPRTYMRGRFDPADGHLLQFVRREMGSRTRVEVEVEKYQPLPPRPGQ